MSLAPRRRWFSSSSFPRLRSHPIHLPSAWFQTRRRWSRRKRSPASGAGPWRRLRRAIPVDRGREEPIVLRHGLGGRVRSSRTGARSGRRRPDWRGSGSPGDRSAPRSRASPVRRVGITTSVRKLGGTPSRSSRRGSGLGPSRSAHGAIDERDREVGGRDRGRARPSRASASGCMPPRMGEEERERQEERGDDADGPEVARRRPRHVGAQKPLPERDAVADLLLEERAPVRDEVVRRDPRRGLRRRADRAAVRRGALRVGDRLAASTSSSDRPGAPRELLDRVTVAVARREVHGAEVAVGSQRRIDEADALEELGPVEGRHRPHAGDHVADRHVRRGLALVLDSHELVGRRARAASCSSSQASAGVDSGSWSRRRWTSWTVNAVGNAAA